MGIAGHSVTRVAFHEAAHVLVGLVVGLDIRVVTICEPGCTMFEQPDVEDPRANQSLLLMSVAGLIGESFAPVVDVLPASDPDRSELQSWRQGLTRGLLVARIRGESACTLWPPEWGPTTVDESEFWLSCLRLNIGDRWSFQQEWKRQALRANEILRRSSRSLSALANELIHREVLTRDEIDAVIGPETGFGRDAPK
jgi:hypothetical protein